MAPWKIGPEISCISGVPWSRDMTSFANQTANRIAMMPKSTTGTI